MNLLKDLGILGLVGVILAHAFKAYWDLYTTRRQFVAASLTESLQMLHGVLERLASPNALTIVGVEQSVSMPGPYILTSDVIRHIPNHRIHHGLLQVKSSFDELERLENRLRQPGLIDSVRLCLLLERASMISRLAFALARTAELLCDKTATRLEFGGHEDMLKFVEDVHRLSAQGIHDIANALRPIVRSLDTKPTGGQRAAEEFEALQTKLQEAVGLVTEIRGRNSVALSPASRRGS
jgi:hypothetical protein